MSPLTPRTVREILLGVIACLIIGFTFSLLITAAFHQARVREETRAD